MLLGAANRVTCSANKVLNPVNWDHMLVKGAWVYTIPHHFFFFFFFVEGAHSTSPD